jgi:transposase-like protein
MAHPEVQDSRLVTLVQEASAQGTDPLRELLRHTIQQVLEEELTSFLNAEPYRRTDARRGYRNGYKPRVLKTRVGRLELQVPKDREGRFQTELFEKYQRNEKALVLAIAEMYVQGVSTRKVKKITEELCGLEISKSQVSALAKGLDAEVGRWRTRPLVKRYPYLVVDALYEKVRHAGSVVSRGVLTVTGIDEDGYREVLGVWCADTESAASWAEVFLELKDRGLSGVVYVVSDNHRGLVDAIHRHFQGAIWQRCQVHFIRNVLGRVHKKDRKRVLRLLREITGASCLESAHNRLREVVTALEQTHPKVADMLDRHGEEMLAVYALPAHHRRRMRTTNMVERLNEEFRRRTRVIRVFPNEAACVRIVSALAIEFTDEWTGRKYLDMEEDDPTAGKSRKDLIQTSEVRHDSVLSP